MRGKNPSETCFLMEDLNSLNKDKQFGGFGSVVAELEVRKIKYTTKYFTYIF